MAIDRLFGRQIVDGAEYGRLAVEIDGEVTRLFAEQNDPQIEDLHDSESIQQQVGGFDVAVHESRGGGVGESGRDLTPAQCHRFDTQRARERRV